MNSLKTSLSRFDANVLCNERGAICPFCNKFNEIEMDDSGIRLKDKTSCIHANRVANISRNYAPLLVIAFHKSRGMH